MDDTPEPFTYGEVFRLIDFSRAIALVICAAAFVLLGIPFIAGLIRSFGGF